jgi:hypothetical protein
VAELLAKYFDRTVIITPRERVAADVPLVSALGIHRRLSQKAIEIMPFSELSGESALEEGIVRVSNVYTGKLTEISNVSVLTYSTARAAQDELAEPLRTLGFEVHEVGDCRQPRTVLSATSEGHRVGLSL